MQQLNRSSMPALSGRGYSESLSGTSAAPRAAVRSLSFSGREPKRARLHAAHTCKATLVTDKPPQVQVMIRWWVTTSMRRELSCQLPSRNLRSSSYIHFLGQAKKPSEVALSLQVDGNGKLEADHVPIRPYSVEKKQDRPRIVVLGSGWGAMSFIKAFKESDRYLT